jgi:hypothetical protein
MRQIIPHNVASHSNAACSVCSLPCWLPTLNHPKFSFPAAAVAAAAAAGNVNTQDPSWFAKVLGQGKCYLWEANTHY